MFWLLKLRTQYRLTYDLFEKNLPLGPYLRSIWKDPTTRPLHDYYFFNTFYISAPQKETYYPFPNHMSRPKLGCCGLGAHLTALSWSQIQGNSRATQRKHETLGSECIFFTHSSDHMASPYSELVYMNSLVIFHTFCRL